MVELVWVFKKGQQCSIITCAFTSQENEIKEPSQTSVGMIILYSSVALGKKAQALVNS